MGRVENGKVVARNVVHRHPLLGKLAPAQVLEVIDVRVSYGRAPVLEGVSFSLQRGECLALVGMTDYARRLPSELSGGQQQRVAIARALANNPPVLIADEPTGNLDSQTAHQVFDLLSSLTEQGKTVIYVTHDPSLAARARARVELLDGRIVHSDGVLA